MKMRFNQPFESRSHFALNPQDRVLDDIEHHQIQWKYFFRTPYFNTIGEINTLSSNIKMGIM